MGNLQTWVEFKSDTLFRSVNLKTEKHAVENTMQPKVFSHDELKWDRSFKDGPKNVFSREDAVNIFKNMIKSNQIKLPES